MNKKLFFLSVLMLVWLIAPCAQSQETVTQKRNLWSQADRKDWKITASNAQGISDGGKGGPATLLLDGRADSYWHSVWDTNVLPGVTIDVDFGKTLILNSILFQQRNMEARQLKTIKIYLKQKATDAWGAAVRVLDLAANTDIQTVTIAQRNAQFMRIEVVSKIDGTASNACLAELGVGIQETYSKKEYDAMAAFLELPVNQTVDKMTATAKENWKGKELGLITPVLRILGEASLDVNEAKIEHTLKLFTNVKSWKSWKGKDWINLQENREGSQWMKLTAPENQSLEARSDTVFISGGGILRKFPVKQSGYQIPVDLIPVDHYIKPSGGKSTTQYTGSHSIVNLWDRNPSGANYHTAVNNAATATTETLEFLFSQKPAVIDYLVYIHAAGSLDKMTIYTKTGTDTEYKKMGEFDWSGVSAFKFPEPLRDVRGIKLEFPVGANGGFVAIKEVEFWAENNEAPLNVALLKVFTELSCSKIKADAKAEDMEALPPFFRTIAEKMKAGTYHQEYRIDEYKAFSDPDKFGRLRNTNPYNLFDNPTGIYAKEGEEIYLLVGETKGRALSLYSVSPASMSRTQYQLKEGINKVKIDRTGLLYINYIADLTTNPEPIKVHIPEGSGIVNGYWDIKKHTGADWRRILENSTFSVIDIVGNNAMAIIFTDVLRENLANSDDISKSVEIWDAVVEAGWNLMGFKKYPLPQNNRMLMLGLEMDGHMYATSYHTGYNKYTLLGEVLYPGVITGNRLWGMGHEVGHCQQHPINYRSMTESSNNLFSQLVLEEVINMKVRKIDEKDIHSLKKAASDMIPACDGLNEVAAGKANHDIDGWSKWGGAYYVFYLYFNKLGVYPDFYKDAYESLRKKGLGDVAVAGPAQLNWYKRVCDISKTDFTEHFEKNGWFVPIDVEGNQYGAYTMKITQAEADAAKAYVASKNYPKPKYRTEFMHQSLTDKSGSQYINGFWTYFRDNAQIRSDISCTVSGSSVRITNGMEAAAFAVETDGKVVYYGDRPNFTVPAGKWNASSKIYAVPIETAKPYVLIYPKP